MRAYLAMLKMRFIHSLQYRAAAWAGVSTQVFWGLMEILLYRAFYVSNASGFAMSLSQTASYIWLRQAFFSLFLLWSVDQDILEMIISGHVAYEIVRPADLYGLWFARNLGTRLSRATLRCIPIFIIGFLIPAPYGLSLPAGPVAALGFLLSFVIGVGITIGLCMWIYIATFYSVASKGVQSIVGASAQFLDGSLIPIPFMPLAWQKVLYFLPFASTQSMPFLIYTGFMRGNELWRGLAIQLMWLVLVIGLGHLAMKRALRKVTVQGG